MPTFSIKEAFAFGFRVFKENALFLIGIAAILAVVSVGSSLLAELFARQGLGIVSALITIVSMVASVVLAMGVIHIALKLYDKGAPTYQDLVSQTRHFVRYLLASILYGLIVFVGLILLVIPGIILGIKFSMYRYFIIDKDTGIIESLKGSSRITKGSYLKLLGFFVLLILLNLLGFLFLGIGLLVTIPISTLAMVYVYRTLLSKTSGVSNTQESQDSVSEQPPTVSPTV